MSKSFLSGISRGVFLGLCSMALFYSWNKKKSLFVVFSIIILSFISLCSFQVNNQFKRLSAEKIWLGYKDGIFSEYRYNRFIMALRMSKDNPFTGVGFRHFRVRFDEYKVKEEEGCVYEFEIPDNMYLSLLSETGIIGLSAFAAFIFYLFKNGFAALTENTRGLKEKEFLLLCMSGVAAFLVNMAAYDMFYWYNPFALFCVLCGAIAAFSFCLLYTSPSPRDRTRARMPSSA